MDAGKDGRGLIVPAGIKVEVDARRRLYRGADSPVPES